MIPSGTSNPPQPQILLDAEYYERYKTIYKAKDGTYRWASYKPIPRWAKAGRVAGVFHQALKDRDAGKRPAPPPDRCFHECEL